MTWPPYTLAVIIIIINSIGTYIVIIIINGIITFIIIVTTTFVGKLFSVLPKTFSNNYDLTLMGRD